MAMSSRDKVVTKASASIPPICRVLITNFEPLFAFSGAILLFINPEQYLSSLTRGQGARTYQSSQQWIYTQLAGGWLLIVFLESVILRLVDDLRVWRLICVAMLLSDICYTHSCAQAVGGWSEWLIVPHWTTEDWIAFVTTWPFVLSRVAIVTGLGIGHGRSAKTN